MVSKISRFYSEHRQRIRRIVLWTAAAIVLWAVAAGLILPPVLRRTAETQLSKNLGSACTLEQVRFNPFTLRLSLKNLHIPLPDGDDFFDLEGFTVRLSPASVYRFAPVLSDLRLVAPKVKMVLRKDGLLSVTELTKNLPKESPAKGEQPVNGETGQGMKLFGVVVTDLEISGGDLLFRDEIRQAEHTVSELSFFVPFTSTLNRHRDQAITPFLEAVVNGRPLRVDGQLTPFAEQLRTEFNIHLDNLELARFQPYAAPFTSAVIKNGQLSTALVFSMLQLPETGLRLGLGGNLTLSGLEVRAPDGKKALRLPRLRVDLDGSLNTAEGMTLRKVEVQGLEAHLALLEDGRLDWLSWMKKSAVAEAPKKDQGRQPQLPIHVELFEFRDGRMFWEDRKVAGGFQAKAEQIALTLSGLHLPGTDPAALQGSLTLNEGGRLALEGKVAALPLKGNIGLRLEELSLADFQPYIVESGIGATLAKGVLRFAGRLEIAERNNNIHVFLKDGEAGLKALTLLRKDTGKAFFEMGELVLTGLAVDLLERQVGMERLLIDRPDLRLRRDRVGAIDLVALLPPSSPPEGVETAAVPVAPAADVKERPWRARLAELKLQEGRISATLEAPRETTTAVFHKLGGTVTGFDTAPGSALGVALSGRGEKGGSFNVDGKALLEPLELDLRLRLDKLNLKPLSPLLADVSPDLRLGSGELTLNLHSAVSKKGEDNLARIKGSVVLDHFSLVDVRQEFAALRTLRVQDLDIDTDRQRYGAGRVSLLRPRLNLIVAGNGINNISRLLGAAPAAEGKAAAPVAEKTAKGNEPYLRFGEVAVSEGSVTVRDERYQPAVSNRLEKMAVTVRGLESAPASRAQIVFSGELDGAPITGEGTMNPLLADFRADLTAEMRTLNLTPFSPMSEKFIAYPLRKGVFTISSKILVDQGRLDSSHRVRLDSLELGDKVKSPDAPDLPVKLGVSLLQDPSGNINLTLPVRGDLKDPSFSVGGLILKVIVNLLMKAVTSPFALLGGMMGDGDGGLEYISFNPGEGRLLAKDAGGLGAIADMLMSRPKINLLLIPHADEGDRQQLADAYVLRRMQELKREDLPKKERETVKPQELPVGPQVDADEYHKLLFKVYKEQTFDKQKNVLGLVRELPPEEMMERIREHYPKDDAALSALAMERAKQLREAFSALQPELEKRILIDAPKVPGEGPRVVFGIK